MVADAETNSLLIAANRTRYEELQSLIERLDRRQDQVLIETALIELTGRDFLDIGVELGFADVPGVGESGGFGVTGFGLSTIQDSDGDGVPDLRVPTVGQGVTAGIIDGDEFSIPMLVALVEEKRNSDVLNVPSVLVNNNSSATVSTLDEQPTTTITATGGGVGGQTQENFNGYEEAGITMTISPSISASRYLRLDVYLEVSTFIGAVQGPIPPPRVTRTIETQINVPDGSTMVIGGIVVDNESTTRTQVPWIGDIPILGRLFSPGDRHPRPHGPLLLRHPTHSQGHRVRRPGGDLLREEAGGGEGDRYRAPAQDRPHVRHVERGRGIIRRAGGLRPPPLHAPAARRDRRRSGGTVPPRGRTHARRRVPGGLSASAHHHPMVSIGELLLDAGLTRDQLEECRGVSAVSGRLHRSG